MQTEKLAHLKIMWIGPNHDVTTGENTEETLSGSVGASWATIISSVLIY
jgi:hypothetical protein